MASAIAKIGVDAVMTLLTSKVADEVGKGLDHLKQVDEVHAHSEGANRNAGNLDNANNVNVGRGNDVDRAKTNPSNLDNTDGVFDKVPAQPRLEPEGANTSPSQIDKTNQPIQTQRNNIDGVPSHTSNRLGNPSAQEIKRIQRDYKPDSESEARAVWHILQQNSTEQVIAGENDIKRFFDISTKEKKVNMVDALKIEKSGMLIPVEVKNMKTIDLYEGQNAAFKKFEAISRRVNMSQIDHFEVMCHPNSGT